MITSTSHLVSVGLSKVVANWGWFLDQIDDGRHIVMTYHHQRGKGTGRTMVADPRCVAIAPGFYRLLLEHGARPPAATERVASYHARQNLSNIAREVMHRASTSSPVHYVVARKMQGTYQRRVMTKDDGPEVVTHPASAGTETVVLVGVDWYSTATGIDRSILHPAELPVAVPDTRSRSRSAS